MKDLAQEHDDLVLYQLDHCISRTMDPQVLSRCCLACFLAYIGGITKFPNFNCGNLTRSEPKLILILVVYYVAMTIIIFIELVYPSEGSRESKFFVPR